jgi:hypothetical protein
MTFTCTSLKLNIINPIVISICLISFFWIDIKPVFFRSLRHSVIKVHEEDYLKSVLTYHEELAPGVERKFANKLDDAFSPCRMFMSFFFRFPLQLTVQEDYSREFTYSWKSFRGWMFFLTGGMYRGLIIHFMPYYIFFKSHRSHLSQWTINCSWIRILHAGLPKSTCFLCHQVVRHHKATEL